ncbi:MAG TPA: class I SAM-dependent methyltransferase [Anaerovoracaceae bacterium]|nr:class I SAM-dependent methyltransferase [Anaerovoracaceae bacterium]
MKSEAVKNNFNDLAGTYGDGVRKKMIPCFDDFYKTGISMLTCRKDAPRVLDLGAGTGLYSDFLLQRYPDAELALIDFSEEMLALAAERFKHRNHTRYILGDYTNYIFEETFDLVVSALSIHHLSAKEKAVCYKKVFDLIETGGEFLNADEIVSPFPDLQKRYEEIWFDKLEDAGFSENEIARTRQSLTLDDPSPVDDQVRWLLESEFSRADCIYKYYNFAVFYAIK